MYGEFHVHAVTFDLHVGDLAHVYATDLYTRSGSEAKGLVEGTVELILLYANHAAGKKLRVKHKPEYHHGNCEKDTDQ